jgi:hypothetical protein
MPLNIYIHIGPPKTGTSAIQKWLKDNTALLLRNGIYYPQHNEDSNGISSGNFSAVFEPVKDDYCFCPSRFASVMAEAVAAGSHTLLLSSEFFFSRLPAVLDAIDNVKCIAYVRNPAELHESHYNQSVKRHGNTDVIRRAESLPMHTLKVLGEYAQRLDARLVLRPYHDELFTGGNIVSDFLDSIELSDCVSVGNADVKRINSSYSLEALEVKRWFNHYDLGPLANPLDRILQAYTGGISDFTFIDKHQFNDYKRQSIRWVERLNEQTAFANGQALIELIREQNYKPFYRQEISEQQCSGVLQFIGVRAPDLLKKLAFCVYAQPSITDVAPFVTTLFSLVSPKQAMPNAWQYFKVSFTRTSHIVSTLNTTLEAEAQVQFDDEILKFRLNTQQLVQSKVNLLAYLKAFWISR